MHSQTMQNATTLPVLDERDVLEQLRHADATDRTLLYLVACATLATLALAAAVSMLS